MKRKLKEKIVLKYCMRIITIIICISSLLVLSDPYNVTDESAENISPTTEAPLTGAVNQSEFHCEPELQVTTTESLSTAAATAFSDRTLNISAPFAGLYNASTGEALYEKDSDKRIHPASLTKILTAITALTYMNTDTVITVGTELNLLPKRSSLCLIKSGHRLTLYDLLTGMLVASGNDAAYTIAVNTARHVMNEDSISDKEAISYFTDLMNSVAKAIGCTDSNFTTPDGFDSEGQYTTIKDLSLICSYALKFKEIREIVSTANKKVVFKSGENVTWSNSNKLLHPDSPYYYSEATGMKTGTTPLAGKCLIATAEFDGQTYVAIVANCESENERYSSVIKLFESFSSK